MKFYPSLREGKDLWLMKNIFLILCTIILNGCATIEVPQYIQDQHPYQRTVYKGFDQTLDATRQALAELGWTIGKETEPSVYERNRLLEGPGKAILLMTDIRRTPFFLGSRYTRLNIYLRGGDKVTEVELRYLTLNSLAIKTIQNYKNDAAVDRIFHRIEENLK